MTEIEKLLNTQHLVNWLAKLYWNTPSEATLFELSTVLPLYDKKTDDMVMDINLIIRGLSAEGIKNIAIDYASLFCGTKPTAPFPYESIYTSSERMLMQAAAIEVKKAYESSGYVPCQDGSNEPADHISFELENTSFLLGKAAKAFGRGDKDDASQWLNKKDEFVDEHILRWIVPFCQEIETQSSTVFFQKVAALTKTVMLQVVPSLSAAEFIE